MWSQRTSWLKVALVAAWMGGCLGMGLVGGVPEQLPGVALGSEVLLVLERALILAFCSERVALALHAAWHGRLLVLRELARPSWRR